MLDFAVGYQDRSGHHYFRLAVPHQLKRYLDRREICVSLRTNDRNEAQRRCRVLHENIKQMYQELSNYGSTESEAEIKAYVKTKVDTILQEVLESHPHFPLIHLESSKKPKVQAPRITSAYKSFLDQLPEEAAVTTSQRLAALALWVELHGDRGLDEITNHKVVEFKKALKTLPANRTKIPKYRGKTLKELQMMDVQEADRIHPSTANNYIGNLRNFMDWATEEYSQYGLQNHFTRKQFKKQRNSKDKRLPFTESELKSIFGTPIFKGCRGTNQRDRYQAGNLIIKDSLYWCTLISLFSGLRMEEALRIRPEDVVNIKGIWCIDISDRDGTRRKTINSLRKVPIHNMLIELGILEVIQSARSSEKALVFCDTPLSKGGKYSKEFSKKYSRFLSRFNCKTPRTSFHSYRHTFIDAMRSAGVPKAIRMAISGHSSQDVHDNYGCIGEPLELLNAELQKVSFPFLKVIDGKLVVI